MVSKTSRSEEPVLLPLVPQAHAKKLTQCCGVDRIAEDAIVQLQVSAEQFAANILFWAKVIANAQGRERVQDKDVRAALLYSRFPLSEP